MLLSSPTLRGHLLVRGLGEARTGPASRAAWVTIHRSSPWPGRPPPLRAPCLTCSLPLHFVPGSLLSHSAVWMKASLRRARLKSRANSRDRMLSCPKVSEP